MAEECGAVVVQEALHEPSRPEKKKVVLKEWVKWFLGLAGLTVTMALSQIIVNLTVPDQCICNYPETVN